MIKLLIRYFKDIGVPVNPFDLEKRLNDHPMPNTVRCISDIMDAYNISHIACELLKEEFLELSPPYITMIDTKKESFCIVETVSPEKIGVYSAISGRQNIKSETFIGISLLDKTPVKELLTNTDYKNIKEPVCNLLLFN